MTCTKYSTTTNRANKLLWLEAEEVMFRYRGLTLREVYFKVKYKKL